MANFHCFLTWFSSLNFPTFLNTLAFFPESALRVAMWNICDSSSLVYRTMCLCARLNCLLRDSGKIRYSDELQSLQIPGHQRLTLITQGDWSAPCEFQPNRVICTGPGEPFPEWRFRSKQNGSRSVCTVWRPKRPDLELMSWIRQSCAKQCLMDLLILSFRKIRVAATSWRWPIVLALPNEE